MAPLDGAFRLPGYTGLGLAQAYAASRIQNLIIFPFLRLSRSLKTKRVQLCSPSQRKFLSIIRFYSHGSEYKVVYCHCLDLKCPLKTHVLQVWSSVWCYWEAVGTFKIWGLLGDFRLLSRWNYQYVPLHLGSLSLFYIPSMR